MRKNFAFKILIIITVMTSGIATAKMDEAMLADLSKLDSAAKSFYASNCEPHVNDWANAINEIGAANKEELPGSRKVYGKGIAMQYIACNSILELAQEITRSRLSMAFKEIKETGIEPNLDYSSVYAAPNTRKMADRLLELVHDYKDGQFEVGMSVSLADLEERIRVSETRIDKIMNPDMIGADLAYFEHESGPAKNTYGNQKIYKINGCEITATIGTKSIHALKVDLSENCTFDINKFFKFSPNTAFPPPHRMTFGDFHAQVYGGRYLADCLTDCGNSYDPSVYLHWEGPRASGLLEVLLEVRLAGDDALVASNKWEKALEEAGGHKWVAERKYYCRKKSYDSIARDAFKDIKITAITIGSGIDPLDNLIPNWCK